jgi:small neutral amino acid transporter SnatA (MarC family)
MTMLSAILLLILVFDPAGNMLTFVSVLKEVNPNRHRLIIAREMLIALGIMVVFLFIGRALLGVLRIEEPSLSIAGGIVLFLIALRMIFPTHEGVFGDTNEGEPLVVPLATPLIAGPSAIATVILLMTRDPGRWVEWLGALVIAWAFSAGILVFAGTLCRLLGPRILTAVQRLMGMVLVTLSVQMLVMGVRAFIHAAPSH